MYSGKYVIILRNYMPSFSIFFHSFFCFMIVENYLFFGINCTASATIVPSAPLLVSST